MLANGITGPITREDAEDVAAMLVSLRRAVPPAQWVDVLADRAAAAALESIF